MGNRGVQGGFTLVELALSMVIIGLLTAVISSGFELKRSAELRSVVADIHKFNTSIRTFEGKFGYLPGDIYNASRYFPACVDEPESACDGNGDGQISPAATEGLRAWQHLALSGLFPGGFTGVMDTSGWIAFEGSNTWKSLLVPTAYAGGGQGKWKVCHNGNTITVANPAVLNAHLMHGDYMGECIGGGSSSGASSSGGSSGGMASSSSSGGSSSSGSGSSGGPVLAECDISNEGYVYGKFTPGINVPASKLANGAYGIDFQDGEDCGYNANHIVLASVENNWLNGSVISPEDSWNIDHKMDDGFAYQGMVEAYNGQSGTDCVDGNLNYVLSNDIAHCQLHFKFE